MTKGEDLLASSAVSAQTFPWGDSLLWASRETSMSSADLNWLTAAFLKYKDRSRSSQEARSRWQGKSGGKIQDFSFSKGVNTTQSPMWNHSLTKSWRDQTVPCAWYGSGRLEKCCVSSASSSCNTLLGNDHYLIHCKHGRKVWWCNFLVPAKRLNSVLFHQRLLEFKHSLFSPNLTS